MISMKQRYLDALAHLNDEQVRKIKIILVILFIRKYDQAEAGGA